MDVKKIGVFCGSKSGDSSIYTTAASETGKLLAKNRIEVIYGGGNIGLMGAIADSVLGNGGTLTGIIPENIKHRDIIHKGINNLIITETRSACKATIYDISDAIIVLPGGFGTVDEFTEFLTLAKLGQHSKPLAVLNSNGFFDHFMAFITMMVAEGFMKAKYIDMILIDEDPKRLLSKLNDRLPLFLAE